MKTKTAKEILDSEFISGFAQRMKEDGIFLDSEIAQPAKDIYSRAKSNERKMFLPEFIPYNPILRIKTWEYKDSKGNTKTLRISHMGVLIFGFIKFYLKNLQKLGVNDRGFYFKDEQLAQLFQVSGQTIQNQVADLKKVDLIKVNVKSFMAGGSIREIFLSEKALKET